MQPNVYYDLVYKNPAWFLKHIRAGGFEVSILNNGISVTPAHAIDDEMADLIRKHKAELIKLLQSESSLPTPISYETTI